MTPSRHRADECAVVLAAAGTPHWLAELDINPLMVLPAGRGVKAAYALAVLPSPA